jgi:hypothetical protein
MDCRLLLLFAKQCKIMSEEEEINVTCVINPTNGPMENSDVLAETQCYN